MEIKKGIGVSPGVVVVQALLLSDEELRIGRKAIAASEIETERQRLLTAIGSSKADIRALRDQTAKEMGPESLVPSRVIVPAPSPVPLQPKLTASVVVVVTAPMPTAPVLSVTQPVAPPGVGALQVPPAAPKPLVAPFASQYQLG